MKIQVKGNKLTFNDKTYNCAVGKNGFAANKREGDNCTPLGTYPLREVLYRPDKLRKPNTKLRTNPISENDGWSDASEALDYNKKVKLPYANSHEKLWRDDNLYDVVVPLGYNDEPVIPGKGSAIFMHIAKQEYQGTEGCIALNKEDLLELLATIGPDTAIEIKA